MDFLISHIDAIMTFVITAGSLFGVMYSKFSILTSRLDKLETRVEIFEQVETRLVARLDRIENKLDSFIQTSK